MPSLVFFQLFEPLAVLQVVLPAPVQVSGPSWNAAKCKAQEPVEGAVSRVFVPPPNMLTPWKVCRVIVLNHSTVNDCPVAPDKFIVIEEPLGRYAMYSAESPVLNRE